MPDSRRWIQAETGALRRIVVISNGVPGRGLGHLAMANVDVREKALGAGLHIRGGRVQPSRSDLGMEGVPTTG